MLQIEQVHQNQTASWIDSDLFGVSDGTSKTYRVAFQGFSGQEYWVAALKDPPWFFQKMFFTRLEVLDAQGNTTTIWVNTASCEKRFSNDYQALAQSALFVADYFAKKLSLAKCPSILSKTEIQRAWEIARNNKDGAARIMDLKETGPSRSMCVGQNGQFILLNSKTFHDKPIGKGSFKEVYYVLDMSTGKFEVLGVGLWERCEDEASWNAIKCEVKMMLAVQDCEFCVKLYASCTEDTRVYFVMENCEGGDLFSAIDQDQLTSKQKKQIAADLVNGLAAMHAKEIQHRDIKPANIFLTKDMRARIGDFGMACHNNDQTRLEIACGTNFYHPPEKAAYIYEPSRKSWVAASTAKADVWAMGLVLYQLFTGSEVPLQQPGDETDLIDRISTLKQSDMDAIIDNASGLPPGMLPILKGMLQVNPALRWTAEQVNKAMSEL